MTATADTRYTFAPQFLKAAAIFAQLAAEIEDEAGNTATESERVLHRGYVVSTIMQCVAALETELYEVTTYGPGSHLGSNRTDDKARAFLKPLAAKINSQKGGVLLRYEKVLHLLKRSKLGEDTPLYEHTKILSRLRNELVHYESKWKGEMKRADLRKKLRDLQHPKPPFVDKNSNFFPHLCLSAACAKWAVRTAVAFLDDFYSRLDVDSPLTPHRPRLSLQ